MQWSYSLESSSRLFQISWKNFLKEANSIKNHHLGLLGCSWRLPWGYSWLLLVSEVTLTHAEFKTLKLFCFTKTQISPSKISRKNAGVIITMSWVWLIFRQLRQWKFVDVWKHSWGRVHPDSGSSPVVISKWCQGWLSEPVATFSDPVDIWSRST